jgi:prepilin-type N-terminal cleavage/methylation domain-containing protein
MITKKIPAQMRSAQRKKGFTLTEIAIVLGIIGLILSAIWVAAAGVYNNQRVNQANTAVLQVLQAVRTLYAQQTTITAGDQSQALVNAGVIPTNLVKQGAVASPFLLTPWGQPMYVGGTTDGLGVAISLNGMTAQLCVGIVAQIFGASHDRTLQTTSVVANAAAPVVPAMATGVNFNTTVPPTTSAPGTPSAAGTGCTAGSNTNSLVAVFGLQG